MSQPKPITPSQHIQLESLLSLAMLTPAQFEQLICRLSNQGVLDDLVTTGGTEDEPARPTVAEARQKQSRPHARPQH